MDTTKTSKFLNKIFTDPNFGSIYRYRNVEIGGILLGFLFEGGINFLFSNNGKDNTRLCYHLAVSLLHKGYEIFYIDIHNPVSFLKECNFYNKIIEMNKIGNIKYYNLYDIQYIVPKGTSVEQYFFNLMDDIERYKKSNSNKKIIVFLDTIQDFIKEVSYKNNKKSKNYFVYNLMDKLKFYRVSHITYIVLHRTAKTDMNELDGVTASDMVYSIKSLQRDIYGNTIDYLVKQEKNRFIASGQVRIQTLDNYESEITDNITDILLDIDEKAILKVIYFNLNKYKELQKMQLNQLVKKELTKLDKKIIKTKISETINKFIELKFLNTRRGHRSTIYLSLNMKNKDFKKLIDEIEQ